MLELKHITKYRIFQQPNLEKISVINGSSIGATLAPMTSQNGGQDGRHDLSISLGLTSDDLVTRSVSPRKVS